MPFVDVEGLLNVKEPELATEGEYYLTVTSFDDYVKKDTQNYVIRCTIGFKDYPDLRKFPMYLSFPGPKDDDNKIETKKLMLARFFHWFGISPTNEGVDTDDIQGATSIKPLRVTREERTDKDDNPIPGEFVNSCFIPRLPGGSEDSDTEEGGKKESGRRSR